MTKYFVLVMLLCAGPAHAESDSWYQEAPDDIECKAEIYGYTVIYTYSSAKPPKTMPVDGLVCVARDYATESAIFQDTTAYFDKKWEQMKK